MTETRDTPDATKGTMMKRYELQLDSDRHRTLRLMAAYAETTNKAVLYALLDIASGDDDLARDVTAAVQDLTAGHALENRKGQRGGSSTRKDRIALISRDGDACQAHGCDVRGAQLAEGEVLHVDHKQPIARGGSDELANKQLLCRDCNLSKGSMSLDRWKKSQDAGAA